jgi:hypothetical protein
LNDSHTVKSFVNLYNGTLLGTKLKDVNIDQVGLTQLIDPRIFILAMSKVLY